MDKLRESVSNHGAKLLKFGVKNSSALGDIRLQNRAVTRSLPGCNPSLREDGENKLYRACVQDVTQEMMGK